MLVYPRVNEINIPAAPDLGGAYRHRACGYRPLACCRPGYGQPAFVAALAADPRANFSAARLVSYVTGLPLGPAGYVYSDTNYILAQMIIERVTHDSYADQLTRRIINPLGLRSMCYAPYTCPAADATRMPTGYFEMPGAPSLLGQPMPPLALTWAQGAGAIVSSLQDMTTWDRDLYQGLAGAAKVGGSYDSPLGAVAWYAAVPAWRRAGACARFGCQLWVDAAEAMRWVSPVREATPSLR